MTEPLGWPRKNKLILLSTIADEYSADAEQCARNMGILLDHVKRLDCIRPGGSPALIRNTAANRDKVEILMSGGNLLLEKKTRRTLKTLF